MKLILDHVSIEDVDIGNDGPEDPRDFDLIMNAVIGDERKGTYCSFSFRLCSPSRLGVTENGVFINNTLVMHNFSWEGVRDRLERLFSHAQSCED